MDSDWPEFPDTNGQPGIASIANTLALGAIAGWNTTMLLAHPAIKAAMLLMANRAPATPEPLSNDSGLILKPGKLEAYLLHCGLDDLSAAKPEREISASGGYMVLITNTRQIRADPYAGTACAYDYAFCRTGPSAQDRDRALVVHFRHIDFEAGWMRFFASKPNKDTRLFLSLADVVVFSDGLFYRTKDGWKIATRRFPEKYLVAAPQDYSLGD